MGHIQTEIRRCTVADIESAPNIGVLLAEYGAESSVAGIGPQSAQFDAYRNMEQLGVLRALGAFADGELIGFMVVILAVLPHYGKLIASTESYFVAKSMRKSGAGLRLLHQGEILAQEYGAAGMFVSAPVGGSLEQVMPKVGYNETNRIFFRALPCAAS